MIPETERNRQSYIKQMMNIEFYNYISQILQVESSDVSSVGAAPVAFNHDYGFMRSNLLEEMQTVGSGGTNSSAAGIDHNDMNGFDLDLDLQLCFEIDDQANQEMDLLEMIISQQQPGNSNLF